MSKFGKIVSISLIIMLFMLMIVGSLNGYINVERKFDKEVHGHMENAYWASTPELMIEELNRSLEGIEELNIRNDMYGAYWNWDKTPDNTVDYEIRHINSVIDRANAVIEWRDGNKTTTGEINDVYESKMKNLRNFLKEDQWSDEVCRQAYIINYHVVWHFFGYICGLFVALIIILLIYLKIAW